MSKKVLLIEVTKDDIAKAKAAKVRSSDWSCDCPISQAVKRTLGTNSVRTGTCTTNIDGKTYNVGDYARTNIIHNADCDKFDCIPTGFITLEERV